MLSSALPRRSVGVLEDFDNLDGVFLGKGGDDVVVFLVGGEEGFSADGFDSIGEVSQKWAFEFGDGLSKQLVVKKIKIGLFEDFQIRVGLVVVFGLEVFFEGKIIADEFESSPVVSVVDGFLLVEGFKPVVMNVVVGLLEFV